MKNLIFSCFAEVNNGNDDYDLDILECTQTEKGFILAGCIPDRKIYFAQSLISINEYLDKNSKGFCPLYKISYMEYYN